MIIPISSKRSLFVAFSAALICMTLSCRKDPTSSSSGIPLLTSNQYSNVVFKLVGYDLLHITHTNGSDLRSNTVVRIAIGCKDSTSFKILLSMPSTYDANINEFFIHFDFTVAMDSTKVQAPLTIRYFAPDSSFVDTDTSVDLIAYPYVSSKLFVTNAIFPYRDYFQDIARVNNILYFHGTGPDGLNRYDLNSHQTTVLFTYPSGDHIDADSSYVYCDVNHDRIDRYDVSTSTVQTGLLSFAPFGIHGVALFERFLYVLEGDYTTGQLTLTKFGLESHTIDSVSYPRATTYMTIYDSVLYAVDWRTHYPNQISRFDLRKNTFLSNVLSPVKSCNGIKVYGNQLLYCDDWKGFVGIVPIADLVSADATPTYTSNFAKYNRAP